jgi:hypothetical protein
MAWARKFLFCLVVLVMLPTTAPAQVSPPIVLPIPNTILPNSLVGNVPGLALVIAGGYAAFDMITGGDPLAWTAFGAGAAAGLVVANIATGGAVLAPMLGAAVAENLGAGLLMNTATRAVAQPGWIRDITLIGSAWIGGRFGSRFYEG